MGKCYHPQISIPLIVKSTELAGKMPDATYYFDKAEKIIKIEKKDGDE